jgi:hypothetical protein
MSTFLFFASLRPGGQLVAEGRQAGSTSILSRTSLAGKTTGPIIDTVLTDGVYVPVYGGTSTAGGRLLLGTSSEPLLLSGDASSLISFSDLSSKIIATSGNKGILSPVLYTPETITTLVPYSGIIVETGWPGNSGFLTVPAMETLFQGTLIDRYGSREGSFVSPVGTPFPNRSLPDAKINAPFEIYEVLRPLNVESGIIAPAYGQPGLGIQYKLPYSIDDLIYYNFLKPITIQGGP